SAILGTKLWYLTLIRLKSGSSVSISHSRVSMPRRAGLAAVARVPFKRNVALWHGQAKPGAPTFTEQPRCGQIVVKTRTYAAFFVSSWLKFSTASLVDKPAGRAATGTTQTRPITSLG